METLKGRENIQFGLFLSPEQLKSGVNKWRSTALEGGSLGQQKWEIVVDPGEKGSDGAESMSVLLRWIQRGSNFGELEEIRASVECILQYNPEDQIKESTEVNFRTEPQSIKWIWKKRDIFPNGEQFEGPLSVICRVKFKSPEIRVKTTNPSTSTATFTANSTATTSKRGQGTPSTCKFKRGVERRGSTIKRGRGRPLGVKNFPKTVTSGVPEAGGGAESPEDTSERSSFSGGSGRMIGRKRGRPKKYRRSSDSSDFNLGGLLLKDETTADGVVEVGEENFKVHKAVLACQSPFFSDLFGKGGRVSLPGSDPAAFKIALYFLYMGSFHPGVDLDRLKLIGILEIALKCGLERLREATISRILEIGEINPEIGVKLVEVASGGSSDEFLDRVLDLIVPFYGELKKLDKWKEIVQDPAHQRMVQRLVLLLG